MKAKVIDFESEKTNARWRLLADDISQMENSALDIARWELEKRFIWVVIRTVYLFWHDAIERRTL